MINSQNTTEVSQQPDPNQVAEKAYQLWDQAGRPQGRDLEFWLLAEARLREKTKTATPLLGSPDPDFAPAQETVRSRNAPPKVSTPKLTGSRSSLTKKRKNNS